MPYASKLHCLKVTNTGSGMVEIHSLDGSNGYRTFSLQKATPIALADAASTDFEVANFQGFGANDLVCIQLDGVKTGRVVIRVISGFADSYSSVIYEAVTPITVAQAGDMVFRLGHYEPADKTSRPDLFCFRVANTLSGMLELTVLSAASGYSAVVLQTATPMNAANMDQFEIRLGGFNRTISSDLFLLKKRQCASGKLEVHVLSASSGYQEFLAHAVTPLAADDADQNFVLLLSSIVFDEADASLAAYANVVGVKTRNCGSGTVEIHDIARFDSYSSFTFHGGSALSENDASNFRFATRLCSIDSRPPSGLPVDARLYIGQQLTADQGPVRLVLQADGNLVIYRDDLGRPVWASNTEGKSISYLAMQGDGNLVLYSTDGKAVWASNTAGNQNASASLKDGGELVVTAQNGSILWSSGPTMQNLLIGGVSVVGSGAASSVFQTSSDGAVYVNHTSKLPNGSVGWTGWASLGGSFISGPVAVRRGPRTDLFAWGTDQSVWHNVNYGIPVPGGGAPPWVGWQSLGFQTSSEPRAVISAPGRIDLFYTSENGDIVTATLIGNAWSGSTTIGGPGSGSVSVVSPRAGEIDLFVRGSDNYLWSRSFTGGNWGMWQCLGGRLSGMPIAVSDGARVAVVAASRSSGLVTIQRAGGNWGSWTAATVNQPTPNKGYMGSNYCDRQYADCCDAADDIENDIERAAAFAACKIEQAACYAGQFLNEAIQWIERVMAPVLEWLSQNLTAVILGAIVVAGIVVCIAFPPAGVVAYIFVLAAA